jgi:hypothetical protein
MIECKQLDIQQVVAMRTTAKLATIAGFQRFRRFLFHDARSGSGQVFPYCGFPAAKIGVV